MAITKETPEVTFIHDRKAPTQEEVWRETTQLHQQRRKVEDMVSLLRPQVEVKFGFKEPIRLIPISDLHLFTIESDYDKINEILDKLKD